MTSRRISSDVSFSGGPLWERVCGEMLSGFQTTRGEGSVAASLRRGTAFLLNSLLRAGGALFCFVVFLVVDGFIALPMKRRPPR